VYIISDNLTHKILNILYAPDYSLQIGDRGTVVNIVNKNMLMVENKGYVNSVIIIKC